MTVLGISVGSKETGICVLRDGQIIDRGVHFYPKQWSGYKLRRIVNRYRHYIERHAVEAIVIKVPPSTSHSAPVRLIMKRVEELAVANGCAFDLITKGELRDRTDTHSTDELIAYAKSLYPELSAQEARGAQYRYAYDKKLYEAVLAAHIVAGWLKGKAENITTE